MSTNQKLPTRDELGASQDARLAEEEALMKVLPEPLWTRVSNYYRADAAAERRRLVELLARHLPCLAPAIRGLAGHIENDDVEGGCCGLPPMDGA